AQRPAPVVDADPPLPPVRRDLLRRPARPHLAHPLGQLADAGAPLVRGRPARRQPGADRPDEPRPQAADVPAAGLDGLQGDRGRLPLRLADRLRLRPPAGRGRHGARRRGDPGAHPEPCPPDRAHLRVPARREAGDRAPVQLDLGAAARRRLRARPRRHRRPGPGRRAAVPQARADRAGHRRLLRVLPGVLHRHRAGVRRPDLQRGARGLRAQPRPQGDREPARHGGDGHPQRLRRRHRVDGPEPGAPRGRARLAAPAQRPGHRGGRGRAGPARRGRPRGGLPVRQRRAHRQRRPGDPGPEPLHPGRRPAGRPLGHRRRAAHRGALQPDRRARAPPLRRRPGLHRVLRLAPGRDQEGPGRDGRARRVGRRRGGRPGVGRAVPAGRPARRRAQLRGRDPGQQPVGQGRRGVPDAHRAPPRPAPAAADRLQRRGAGAHRGRRRRGDRGADVGRLRRRVPALRRGDRRPGAGLGPVRAARAAVELGGRGRGRPLGRPRRRRRRGDRGRRGQRPGGGLRRRPRAAGGGRRGARLRRARPRRGRRRAGGRLRRVRGRRAVAVGGGHRREHRRGLAQGGRLRGQPRAAGRAV
ncbi:MAG: 2-isopropylmalate synthase, partial [uncultured Quadrisphaera sp.]